MRPTVIFGELGPHGKLVPLHYTLYICSYLTIKQHADQIFIVVLFNKKLLLIDPHIAIETILTKNRQKMPKKSPPSHPTGIVVDIVGTEESSQGRTCDDGKTACGSLLVTVSLVRFWQVQVLVDDVEETALAVYLISEGIDRYRVGFLQRFLVKHKKKYDG